jgi:hypothetical protein
MHNTNCIHTHRDLHTSMHATLSHVWLCVCVCGCVCVCVCTAWFTNGLFQISVSTHIHTLTLHKHVNTTQVIGVEPERCASYTEALKHGSPTAVSVAPTCEQHMRCMACLLAVCLHGSSLSRVLVLPLNLRIIFLLICARDKSVLARMLRSAAILSSLPFKGRECERVCDMHEFQLEHAKQKTYQQIRMGTLHSRLCISISMLYLFHMHDSENMIRCARTKFHA